MTTRTLALLAFQLLTDGAAVVVFRCLFHHADCRTVFQSGHQTEFMKSGCPRVGSAMSLSADGAAVLFPAAVAVAAAAAVTKASVTHFTF